jgi:uncharacterized DUF497 family protein
MKFYDWNQEKNLHLLKTRGVCFEEVLQALSEDGLLATVTHPNKSHYAHQKMYVVQLQNYAYLVPFVEDSEKIFLKTIIPSRVATKRYLKRRIL